MNYNDILTNVYKNLKNFLSAKGDTLDYGYYNTFIINDKLSDNTHCSSCLNCEIIDGPQYRTIFKVSFIVNGRHLTLNTKLAKNAMYIEEYTKKHYRFTYDYAKDDETVEEYALKISQDIQAVLQDKYYYIARNKKISRTTKYLQQKVTSLVELDAVVLADVVNRYNHDLSIEVSSVKISSDNTHVEAYSLLFIDKFKGMLYCKASLNEPTKLNVKIKFGYSGNNVMAPILYKLNAASGTTAEIFEKACNIIKNYKETVENFTKNCAKYF